MSKNPQTTAQTSVSTYISRIFMLIGCFLLFLVIGQLVGMFGLSLITNQTYQNLALVIQQPQLYKNAWLGMMFYQSISTVFAFVFSGIFVWKLFDKKNISTLFNYSKINFYLLFQIVLLMLVSLPVVAWLSVINKALVLPDFMAGLEIWMKTQEDKLAALTDFLTTFSGLDKYLIALVVVAIIPAIGEEIIFRGLIQRYLTKIFNNPHFAIWISAFVFSAIHLQFYGFLVRFFLGIILGYICYYTESLSAAIIGHFVNNSIVLTVMYFSKNNILDYNLEKSESLSLAPTLLFFAIIFYILNKIRKENTRPFIENLL